MKDIVYLEVAEVIQIHHQFMEHTGTRSQGIRVQNELEPAIARPQVEALYDNAEIIRQASVLAIGIS